MIGEETLNNKYVYNLIARRKGEKTILCTYSGDDYGLYDFNVERVEVKHECCGKCTGECKDDCSTS